MKNSLYNLGTCLFTLVCFCIVIYGIWRAWLPPNKTTMSSKAAPPDVKPNAGIVPVSDTSIKPSRHMSDIDIIAMLSMVRTTEQKWRFSANKIQQLIGGNRNDVLDVISDLRDTGTEYVGDLIARVEKEVKQENAGT
jgi:hypothetical protein